MSVKFSVDLPNTDG